MRPASLRALISSGGVIYRKNADIIEVALILGRGGRYWCLPKGEIDVGETSETAAVRVAREKAGISGRIIDKLDEKTYWYFNKRDNIRCRKNIHYYLIEYDNGGSQYSVKVEDVQWFPLNIAIEKIRYKGNHKVLEKALIRLRLAD